MTRPLRFGLMTLQTPGYGELADRWHRAESMGWDSLWIADHTTSQYPGLIAYEAWALLGAMARETRTIRLGTLVTPIALRHPYVLAMSVTTVDHASGGRIELGLGAGGATRDEESVGIGGWPTRERLERLEEQVQILDRLLRGETVTANGRYRLTDASIEMTVQRPRPPIIVAAQGPKGLALVARHADGWNTLGGQPMRSTGRITASLDEAVAETRRLVERLDEACAAIGRDPRSVRRSVLAYRADVFASQDAFEDYVGRYGAIGIDEIIAYWPSDPATFAISRERESVMERVAADVLPGLRAHVPA